MKYFIAHRGESFFAPENTLAAIKQAWIHNADGVEIDIRLSKDNQLYVLEVNPNPDLTEGAGFLRSTEAAGYSYVQTLEEIIKFALARGC